MYLSISKSGTPAAILHRARFALTTFCVLALCGSALGQSSQPSTESTERAAYEAAITGLLRATVDEGELPAIGAAVIRDQKLVGVAVAGVRRAGSPEPVTTADVWHLGSCGKAMTATVIAMLVEEGKLKWDSTLADVFPELASAMHEQFRSVTLDQLLAHRSGIGDDTARNQWLRMRQGDDSLTEKRLRALRETTAAEPSYAPGSKAVYSNLGFTFAGAMAERVTNTAWETLIRKGLFEPLGMTSAGFGAPGVRDAVEQPMGHMEAGAKPTAVLPGPLADNPPALAPAGTVHMSLADWAKFVGMHLAGPTGGSKLLKPESFKHLHESQYGDGDPSCGWIKVERPWGGHVLTHSGSNTYWFCTVWAAPEKGLAVMVTTNRGGEARSATLDKIISPLILDATGRKPLPH